MADEGSSEADEARDGSDAKETEDNRPDDTLAESKKCPECGAPVDDVRATCINCGYEYKDEDHEDSEAGNEFMSGSQVDEKGNELPDDEGNEGSSNDEGEDGE